MLDKMIFIVNGKPGAGKDTFAQFLNDIIPVYKYSAVDKVKTIALDCGWNGKKEERDRKFLSDLKMLTSAYSDMSFRDLEEKVMDFHLDLIEERILLIDIREPEEIKRACEAFDAKSIFIKNDNVPAITSNEADANVENYEYDYVIENSGTLQEFMDHIYDFYISLYEPKKKPVGVYEKFMAEQQEEDEEDELFETLSDMKFSEIEEEILAAFMEEFNKFLDAMDAAEENDEDDKGEN